MIMGMEQPNHSATVSSARCTVLLVWLALALTNNFMNAPVPMLVYTTAPMMNPKPLLPREQVVYIKLFLSRIKLHPYGRCKNVFTITTTSS